VLDVFFVSLKRLHNKENIEHHTPCFVQKSTKQSETMAKPSRELLKRADNKCELCSGSESLDVYDVTPKSDEIVICATCIEQLSDVSKVEANHWRCLNESMWSEVPAVQVVAYRMLHQLKSENPWALDLMDMLYLGEETLEWAKTGIVESGGVKHLDSNGVELKAGDSVIITQTLKVKGSSVTAKRGTAVRRISLVAGNPDQIEGRVEGQQIVILTKFVKKQ